MDPAVQTWLDGLPLAAEQKANLAAVFGEGDVHNYVKRSVLAPGDYSRKQDEIAAKQKEIDSERATLKAETDKANALINSNTEWKNSEEKRFNAAVQRAQAAEQRLLKLQQKFRDDYGQYPDLLKEFELDKDILTELPKIEDPVNPNNQPKYLTPEEADQRGMVLLRLSNQIRKVERQHMKEFGNLDKFDEDALVDFALKNGYKDLTKAWQDTTVEDRQAAQEASWKKRTEDAIATAKQQWESDEALKRQAGDAPRKLDSSPDPEHRQFQRIMESKDKPTSNQQGEQERKRARIQRATQNFDQVLTDGGKNMALRP